MTTNVEFENCKFLIKKYLKPEQINYAREVKIAKQLLTNYPDVEFWQIYELGFKLNSLAYFVGEGAKELNKQYQIASLNIPEPPKFEADTGQYLFPFKIKQKPQTIRDFLLK